MSFTARLLAVAAAGALAAGAAEAETIYLSAARMVDPASGQAIERRARLRFQPGRGGSI